MSSVSRKVVAFVVPALLAACAADKSAPSQQETRLGPLSSPSVTTDSATYSPGATITVTYSGLPGNVDDWIAIAPAGSANTTYLAGYVFTNGQMSGTATFTAPAAGTYVARSFPNNTFSLIAESASFTVGAPTTISTDHASYVPGATITVTYSGLPGNLDDWIAIAPAGSPNTTYLAGYVFTNGQTSGTATFTAPAAGTYVARSFPNNTFSLIAESASFTVGAATTISTDHASYVTGATITVTYSGLPGNLDDWIAIAPAGSANTTYLAGYVFTNGQTSGTATFTAPAAGTYVARSFPNNTFSLIAESASFTVGAATTISTDQASYVPGATITVTYSGLPGNVDDWIAIAPAGSANTTYLAGYVFTNGQMSGTATFTAPAAGTYVARSFPNNTFSLIAESASFTVGAATTISTDHASYVPGATITVTYSGLPGNLDDWIAIAPAGSANTSYLAGYVFTNGQTSGTATFTAPAAGTYVARSFPNNTYALIAESASFTVCGDSGTTLCFVAALKGAEEVPGNSSTATGAAVFLFDTTTRGITYQLEHTVVNATAAHIHQAAGGVVGGVIVPFTLVGQGASGSAVLTQGQADDLVAGNLYANVHSSAFGAGEVRGQIMRPGQDPVPRKPDRRAADDPERVDRDRHRERHLRSRDQRHHLQAPPHGRERDRRSHPSGARGRGRIPSSYLSRWWARTRAAPQR